MEFTFSSRTRNALLSANNYEIFYERSFPSAFTALDASVTAMGTITYTLTFISTEEDASLTGERLTWTDSILTYRNQDPLETSLPIAVRRTLSLWYPKIWRMYTNGTRMDGQPSWARPNHEMSFYDWHESDFRQLTCFSLNAFYSFANGVSGGQRPPTPEDDEWSFENLRP